MLEKFNDLVQQSQNIVVFTGAGISTESGVPDFRTPNGVWSRYAPIDFGDFMASQEMRDETWRRKIMLDAEIGVPEPNAGHLKIAELVLSGKVSHVITQNIDNLHQNSGVPADKVIELHGNGTYAACLSCHTRYALDEVKTRFNETGKAPDCNQCGGHIKSATISFGQPMPEMPMRLALEATQKCDLFFAIGSSLVVSPANQFPLIAKHGGAKLVILNRDETPLDSQADLVLHFEIGETLSQLKTP
ncbi:MAG: SIR2 family NAD-dependent protein deacylase [Parvibaculales bacterium]